VLLQGAAARSCCQSAVCALELGCWCHYTVVVQSAAVRVLWLCCGCAVGLGWCPCGLLLSECCGCVLELVCWRRLTVRVHAAARRCFQGAAARVLFVLWSLVAGAAAGLRRRVPL